MNSFWTKLRTTLEMIKFEHTLFALPFAFLGAVLAANGLPSLWQITFITLAMIGARSAAMSFNRIVDRDIDAKNPRTARREIPSGKLSLSFAWSFMIASCALFFAASAMLNSLTLALSPIALASVLVYSYTKRFTAFAHLFLGWALAISPTAAWIAVRGAIDAPTLILISLLVMMWTAGFDILYACQDYEFDKKTGLRSIPARFGVSGAFMIARVFHFQAFLILVLLYVETNLGFIALAGVVAVGALLIYQHLLVKPTDLSRMNAAFFTTNAFVSVILFLTFGAAVFVSKF
ncbi:MAG: UbiA family prenyltransferase [Pyrinomonadaceae bacterium]|nr:UbiA family prenyltransferase [Pyrinomonadaceae bacterium]